MNKSANGSVFTITAIAIVIRVAYFAAGYIACKNVIKAKAKAEALMTEAGIK